MSLRQLVDCIQHHPALFHVQSEKLSLYISLVRHLKPRIAFTQLSTQAGAPDGLLRSIHNFLQLVLDIDDYMAQLCWSALKDLAWEDRELAPPEISSLIPRFLEHGTQLGVPIHEYLPLIRKCIRPDCPNNPLRRLSGQAPDLREANTVRATLFTRSYGPIPVYTTSTYCRGCSTRYHYNCYVQANIRTYYHNESGSCPNAIQVSPHFFVEIELCERFATQMCMAWTSAQNCARIYNDEALSYPWAAALPQHWPIYKLDYEAVWDAFVIHALLDWHRDHGTTLHVPHQAPTQAARWHHALTVRNMAMAGTGQPAWNHACDLCTKHIKDADGRIVGAYRSVVTDGISLGHPCCAVHNCKESLPTSKARLCEKHNVLKGKCAVEKCNSPAESSFRTCAIPAHREAEARFLDHGKAMFQLKQRLAKISPTVDAEPAYDNADTPVDDPTDDEILVEEDGAVVDPCNKKPTSGLRKVFARFGRRRTHNEELCVASCGVILGCATFYGAEGPNSVRVFWKQLFPTQASLPSVMWYDNNCHVAAMLAKDNDTYFENVALPVDVFHFKSKHKETDGFCGRYCNPARWIELMDKTTGRWTFNSSAAEQVNLWASGFHAITRLMRDDRFNFFLDEMISRRNRTVIRNLDAAGRAPYSIPREELLGS